MKMLNKIQLIIILIFVALGVYGFLSPYFIKNSGVTVVSVANPTCQNIHTGDLITEVGGNQIRSIEDFNSARFSPKQFVSLVVNSGPAGCIALSDGSVGIVVNPLSSSGIVYGTDLVGGRKYNINSSLISASQLQNVSQILKARTSYLGLADVKIQNTNNQLTITTGKGTNIDQLLFIGYVECDIEVPLTLKNSVASFQIGNDNYTVQKINNNFLVDNMNHSLNESFYLKDVKTTIINDTNTTVILSLSVFNNSDILGEVPGYTQVTFDSNTGNYNFNILVRLSTSAGKKFYDIVQNIKTIVVGSQVSLDSALVSKLDDNVLSRLAMPVNLKGQEISTLYIVGSDSNKQSLLNKKNVVEASINSGILTQNLTVSSSEYIAATQQGNVLILLLIISLLVVVVPLYFATKHKKIKHSVFAILIGITEIFSVISLFIALQIFYKLNFALDFASLIGMAFLAGNWMMNELSTNLSAHLQKELIIKIKYKKIISVTGLTKIALVILSFIFGAYGYTSATVIILLGILLDYLIFRPFYKSFI